MTRSIGKAIISKLSVLLRLGGLMMSFGDLFTSCNLGVETVHRWTTYPEYSFLYTMLGALQWMGF